MKLAILEGLFLMFVMASATPLNSFPDANVAAQMVQKFKHFTAGRGNNIVRMPSASENIGSYKLIQNAYLVEFDQHAGVKSFHQTIADSLERSHGIPRSALTMRQIISTSLFSGASFSVNTEHSIKAIESIPGSIAIYPVYSVPGPKPVDNYQPPGRAGHNHIDPINAHQLTGVAQVHDKLNNFGKGIRIAVIDTGIDYSHPALGGCFGPGCKVAFGFDLVGDAYGSADPIPVPDNDPIDNCSKESHGTHVAGIIAANATGITQAGFIPVKSFLGVAPQATLGAYRIFGCPADGTSTDVITAAIYLAAADNVDIITMSVGSIGAYTESSDAVAAQRVSDAGIYVTFSFGNDGGEGLQTGGNPALSSGAIAVASVDNSDAAQLYLITPDNKKIFYLPGAAFGGWSSILSSTIIVNDPKATANDGCYGPAKPVAGAIVLYAYNTSDLCNSAYRCNEAAAAGATGCLLYNVGAITGSSFIPSGSISLADGLSIVAIVSKSPSATFTFTNLLAFSPNPTVGTPSYFTSFGLTGDLLFKPQLSGIGGYVYSTISSFSTNYQKLAEAYASYSGTSMACPYVAGTLALFLAQIGNPASNTVGSKLGSGNRRPSFSEVVNLFQSNSKPVNIYNTNLLATTAQQGAGLVNAFQALTATTVISPSELALNDTVRQEKSYEIKVSNIGKKPVWYRISHRGAALATGAQKGNDQLLATPLYSTDYANVQIWPIYFKLDPGKSRVVTLQFQAPHKANADLLPIFSGFIDVSNDVDEKVAHVSYAGVVGNYKNAQIFVRNTPSGIITGILDSTGEFISDGEQLNMTASGAFPIVMVTAWASRIVFVELISGIDNVLPGFTPSYGLLYDVSGYGPLYFTNVPRNGATAFGQAYSQYYLFIWSGLVSTVISNENDSFFSTSELPPGQYKLRFSALKHFGKYTNDDDFEVYETPSFELVY